MKTAGESNETRWFAVLDRFDAATKGHTAGARHLYETHGVDGWHASGDHEAVAYLRHAGQWRDSFDEGVANVSS